MTNQAFTGSDPTFEIVLSSYGMQRRIKLPVVSAAVVGRDKDRVRYVVKLGEHAASLFTRPGVAEFKAGFTWYAGDPKFEDIPEWANGRAESMYKEFLAKFKISFTFTGEALVPVKRIRAGSTSASAKFEVEFKPDQFTEFTGEVKRRVFTLPTSQIVAKEGVLYAPRWLILKKKSSDDLLPEGVVLEANPGRALVEQLAAVIIELCGEQVKLQEEALARHVAQLRKQ